MHRTVSEQQLFKNGAQKQKFPIWKIPINLLHEVLRVTSNDVMLSAGEFSSSYAVLCTPSFTGGVRTTYPTSWGLSTSVVHAPAYDLLQQRTSRYRSYRQNVESAPFLTLGLPRGTLYQKTCVLFLTLCFLWSPYVIGRPYIFSSCFFLSSFFSSRNLSGRRLDV